MSMKDLQKAVVLIKDNFTKEECVFSTPKSAQLIKLAEKKLAINFPLTYCDFIKKYGFGGPGGLIISGLRTDHPDEIKTTGVVWKNLNKREQLKQPNHLIEIESVGDGTTYCLDTSQMNEEGECPVVAWPLGGYEETPVLEVVAEDFGKFFLDMVQRQIEYKKVRKGLAK